MLVFIHAESCRSDSALNIFMPSLSKRDRAALLGNRLGLTRLLEAAPRRNCLIVLNYHRIGDARTSQYDSAVFSATAEDFETQVAHLRRYYNVVSLDEAVASLLNPGWNAASRILITFDDGYLDNYTTAFPILKAHGLSAVFFLCTAYVGSAIIPWWDQIAYIVRNANKHVLRIDYPDAHEFDLTAGVDSAIVRILKIFKSPATKDPRRMIAALESAAEVASPVGSERTFLNWDEAAEMLKGGMSIGSHTHTHRLLEKLPFEEQLQELATSKKLLEERLRTEVISLAYPVGGATAYSSITMDAAAELGYKAAFSYYGGFNYPGRTDKFDIRRNAVDSDTTFFRFRFQLALGTVSGKYWI